VYAKSEYGVSKLGLAYLGKPEWAYCVLFIVSVTGNEEKEEVSL